MVWGVGLGDVRMGLGLEGWSWIGEVVVGGGGAAGVRVEEGWEVVVGWAWGMDKRGNSRGRKHGGLPTVV